MDADKLRDAYWAQARMRPDINWLPATFDADGHWIVNILLGENNEHRLEVHEQGGRGAEWLRSMYVATESGARRAHIAQMADLVGVTLS